MDNISAGASATRMAHLSQVLLCLYGLRFSYSAITKLQKYEQTTETLATYSKDVKTHLSLTRSTQATGLITLVLSLIASLILAIYGGENLPRWIKFSLSPTLLLLTMFARGHIKSYWTPYGTNFTTPLPTSTKNSANSGQNAKDAVTDTAEKVKGEAQDLAEGVGEVVQGAKVEAAKAAKKLPRMSEYSVAEEMTERELEVLQYLEWSWLVTSFFMGVGLG